MTSQTTIESSVLGEQMTFVRTAEDTNGEELDMLVCYAPKADWDDVPYHLHHNQDEFFEVLEGTMTVEIAGARRAYSAGETFEVPRGTEHVMRNLGSVPTTVRWRVRPALQTQQFFETTFALAERGTLYHPLQFAVIAQTYKHVFHLTRLPVPMRLLLPLLAALGRVLGYRAYDQRFRAVPIGSHEATH